MRVMGIDPGLATTGYGVVDRADDGYILVEAGVITTPPEEPLPRRLKKIYDGVRGLIAEFQPDGLAVEELYFAKNVKTALSVAQARGAILLAAYELPIASYTPLEVKLQITGFGRAAKGQIPGMVTRLLSLPEPPRPDDAADALALALCHLLREEVHVEVEGD
jgi:crossover junction endodeoxyribonuclease RuvC